MNINYEEIDILMRPIIKILNSNGVKTKFCCQGHGDYDQVYISFDNTMEEKDLIFLVKMFDYNYLLAHSLPNNITPLHQFQLQKWVRYNKGKIVGDWSLEIRNILDSERELILKKVENRLVNYFNENKGEG